MGYWHEPGDRLAPAGDDIFLARLDLANAAREGLVGFAQADHLAHSSHPGQPRPRSEAAASRLIIFTEFYVARNGATYKVRRQPLPSRSSAAFTSASGTAILIPARSCWRSIATH